MLGFSITVRDIVDIFIISILLYEVYRLLRRSGASNLFWGITAFILISILVSSVFELPMTGALFNRIIDVGAIALIVIFQEEIRDFFYRLGARFSHMQHFYFKRKKYSARQINEIHHACIDMAANRTGAIIVLSCGVDLSSIAQTGEILDATISSRLIENIFFKNSPLHDGALIIHNDKILSAACILPVSRNSKIPAHFGLRHRAAIGITEKYKVRVIVVSEETGQIAIVEDGKIEMSNENSFIDFIAGAMNGNK